MEILPVFLFILFAAFVLGLSFYLSRKTRSANGYFAAGSRIHWSLNGVAFAGNYLSDALFLCICGMIATMGYDRFLYSIGYLAGWIVALFVVAEPMKRLGKCTFTEAIDSKYNSRGIQLVAGISTLVISIFYLIPQMVGAGVLVTPFLGLPHAIGVIMVRAIVIIIVATAGMTSTTYVQFLKGAPLVVFSLTLTIGLLWRGLSTEPDQGGRVKFQKYESITLQVVPKIGENLDIKGKSYEVAIQILIKDTEGNPRNTYIKLADGEIMTYWKQELKEDGDIFLQQMASQTLKADGTKLINGIQSGEADEPQIGNLVKIIRKEGEEAKISHVGPFKFLSILSNPETIV